MNNKSNSGYIIPFSAEDAQYAPGAEIITDQRRLLEIHHGDTTDPLYQQSLRMLQMKQRLDQTSPTLN